MTISSYHFPLCVSTHVAPLLDARSDSLSARVSSMNRKLADNQYPWSLLCITWANDVHVALSHETQPVVREYGSDYTI